MCIHACPCISDVADMDGTGFHTTCAWGLRVHELVVHWIYVEICIEFIWSANAAPGLLGRGHVPVHVVYICAHSIAILCLASVPHVISCYQPQIRTLFVSLSLASHSVPLQYFLYFHIVIINNDNFLVTPSCARLCVCLCRARRACGGRCAIKPGCWT